MSIEAKTVLMKELEKRLSETIPAREMAQIMTVAADALVYFDVAQKETEAYKSDDLLDAYIAAMKVQGRSGKTVERYSYIIKRMMESVKVNTRGITVYHLRQYLMKEKERGISDSTLEGTRQVFSAYFNWLQREGLIDSNPTANLGTIKRQKKIKAIYSDVDIERMKFCCESVRDRAIVSFLLSTGCRISEVCGLNRTDVDVTNLECTVLGKGNKERTVYIDSVTAMLLKEYMASRTDLYPALFVGRGTQRITPHGVRRMLVKLSEAAKVEHVHPHKFRRTLATNLIRHGMPIQEVASILGHDKLDTTMQYVVLDKSDVKNSYRKYA